MIIEFKTVRTNEQEMYDKTIAAKRAKEMGMDDTPSFFNEHDWIARTTLEMNDVVDWSEGKIWINEIEAPCVYARLKGGMMTSAILVTLEDFQRVYEKATNTQVKTVGKFLERDDG